MCGDHMSPTACLVLKYFDDTSDNKHSDRFTSSVTRPSPFRSQFWPILSWRTSLTSMIHHPDSELSETGWLYFPSYPKKVMTVALEHTTSLSVSPIPSTLEFHVQGDQSRITWSQNKSPTGNLLLNPKQRYQHLKLIKSSVFLVFLSSSRDIYTMLLFCAGHTTSNIFHQTLRTVNKHTIEPRGIKSPHYIYWGVPNWKVSTKLKGYSLLEVKFPEFLWI